MPMCDETGTDKTVSIVAIGTNDGVNICETHFGMSRRYMVYDIEGRLVKRHWEVENPYSDPQRHKYAETDDIMGVLDGVDVCIGRRMGRKSPPIILRYGRVPLLTEAVAVQEGLDAFLALRHELFKRYSIDRRDWVPMERDVLQVLVASGENEEAVR